jgi:hypothetical protein
VNVTDGQFVRNQEGIAKYSRAGDEIYSPDDPVGNLIQFDRYVEAIRGDPAGLLAVLDRHKRIIGLKEWFNVHTVCDNAAWKRVQPGSMNTTIRVTHQLEVLHGLAQWSNLEKDGLIPMNVRLNVAAAWEQAALWVLAHEEAYTPSLYARVWAAIQGTPGTHTNVQAAVNTTAPATLLVQKQSMFIQRSMYRQEGDDMELLAQVEGNWASGVQGVFDATSGRVKFVRGTLQDSVQLQEDLQRKAEEVSQLTDDVTAAQEAVEQSTAAQVQLLQERNSLQESLKLAEATAELMTTAGKWTPEMQNLALVNTKLTQQTEKNLDLQKVASDVSDQLQNVTTALTNATRDAEIRVLRWAARDAARVKTYDELLNNRNAERREHQRLGELQLTALGEQENKTGEMQQKLGDQEQKVDGLQAELTATSKLQEKLLSEYGHMAQYLEVSAGRDTVYNTTAIDMAAFQNRLALERTVATVKTLGVMALLPTSSFRLQEDQILKVLNSHETALHMPNLTTSLQSTWLADLFTRVDVPTFEITLKNGNTMTVEGTRLDLTSPTMIDKRISVVTSLVSQTVTLLSTGTWKDSHTCQYALDMSRIREGMFKHMLTDLQSSPNEDANASRTVDGNGLSWGTKMSRQALSDLTQQYQMARDEGAERNKSPKRAAAAAAAAEEKSTAWRTSDMSRVHGVTATSWPERIMNPLQCAVLVQSRVLNRCVDAARVVLPGVVVGHEVVYPIMKQVSTYLLTSAEWMDYLSMVQIFASFASMSAIVAASMQWNASCDEKEDERTCEDVRSIVTANLATKTTNQKDTMVAWAMQSLQILATSGTFLRALDMFQVNTDPNGLCMVTAFAMFYGVLIILTCQCDASVGELQYKPASGAVSVNAPPIDKRMSQACTEAVVMVAELVVPLLAITAGTRVLDAVMPEMGIPTTLIACATHTWVSGLQNGVSFVRALRDTYYSKGWKKARPLTRMLVISVGGYTQYQGGSGYPGGWGDVPGFAEQIAAVPVAVANAPAVVQKWVEALSSHRGDSHVMSQADHTIFIDLLVGLTREIAYTIAQMDRGKNTTDDHAFTTASNLAAWPPVHSDLVTIPTEITMQLSVPNLASRWNSSQDLTVVIDDIANRRLSGGIRRSGARCNNGWYVRAAVAPHTSPTVMGLYPAVGPAPSPLTGSIQDAWTAKVAYITTIRHPTLGDTGRVAGVQSHFRNDVRSTTRQVKALHTMQHDKFKKILQEPSYEVAYVAYNATMASPIHWQAISNMSTRKKVCLVQATCVNLYLPNHLTGIEFTIEVANTGVYSVLMGLTMYNTPPESLQHIGPKVQAVYDNLHSAMAPFHTVDDIMELATSVATNESGVMVEVCIAQWRCVLPSGFSTTPWRPKRTTANHSLH